jgi:hypothetical protein
LNSRGFFEVNEEASTDLSPLAALGPNKLQLLNLRYPQVSDASLAYLQDLSALHILFLHDTQVSDAGLIHLQQLLALQKLFFDNTQEWGTQVFSVRTLKNLLTQLENLS